MTATTEQQIKDESVMKPPGTKSRPIQHTCRQVGKNNPSIIIGIPKIIVDIAHINHKDKFNIYYEPTGKKGHYRIILEH
jgi:hypothetical protein